jgi:pyruvate formate lyase activating enzyme
MKKLKALGYAIKLDTNGWDPKTLKKIIDSKIVDYIAMDIKASPEKYLATISNSEFLISNENQNDQMINKKMNDQWKMNNDKLIADIKKSIGLIMQSKIDYEFRTTVCHPIHEVEDFEEIGKLIHGAKRYFIQNYVKSKQIDEKIDFRPFDDEELEISNQFVARFVKNSTIR